LDFNTRLRQSANLVNRTLIQLLDEHVQTAGRLKDAMRYTLETPGKRIRAALLMWCCELVSGRLTPAAEVAAAAIEMVHTYSLVHDDLPAMDDDELRRGLPTCHKAFDEATAVLTGDALLTLAFEVLARKIDDPALAVKLIARLADAAGADGMVAGQMADLESENSEATAELLEHIHTNKTAKMFRCAAEMGALAGGANDEQLGRLSEFGLKIGLGFQIADDILDVSSTTEQLGKTAGKDEKAAKCTYPALMGIEKSKELEKQLAAEAIAALEPFGETAQTLRDLTAALLERTK